MVTASSRSRIREFMRAVRRGSPYALLVVIALVMGANLAGTIRGVTLLELQERHRAIEASEQVVSASWVDIHGVRQTLESPRLPGEDRAVWAARHLEAEALFIGHLSTK